MIGYIHEDDGKRWLRIEEPFTGDVWDEPASNFNQVLDLTNGTAYWRHIRTGMIVHQE